MAYSSKSGVKISSTKSAILAVTFYLARNDKIALFVDEIFTPDFDE